MKRYGVVVQDESILEALGKLGCEQSPPMDVEHLQTANVQVYTRLTSGARLVNVSRGGGCKLLDLQKERCRREIGKYEVALSKLLG
jgi:hypothetical protein